MKSPQADKEIAKNRQQSYRTETEKDTTLPHKDNPDKQMTKNRLWSCHVQIDIHGASVNKTVWNEAEPQH